MEKQVLRGADPEPVQALGDSRADPLQSIDGDLVR